MGRIKHTVRGKELFFKLMRHAARYCRVGLATDDSKMLLMRFACWVTKATDTLKICDNYCFSAAIMVTPKLHVSLYKYVHYLLYCVLIIM